MNPHQAHPEILSHSQLKDDENATVRGIFQAPALKTLHLHHLEMTEP